MKTASVTVYLRRIAFASVVIAIVGCASQKPEPDMEAAPTAVTAPEAAASPEQTTASAQVQRDFPALRTGPVDPRSIVGVYDPLESLNRSVYKFNTRFDRYVFLPVVSGYEAVMPDIAEKGVSNFFQNLTEVRNFVNNILQGEIVDSGITLGRFVINSTVGVAGLWDPATKMEIYARKEDFGDTLGVWGVGPGPFLVLPILGPSSLRDTGGLAFDMSVKNAADIFHTKDDANRDDVRVSLDLLNAIDTRKNTKFRYYETGSPFEYTLVRYAYIRMREAKVKE